MICPRRGLNHAHLLSTSMRTHYVLQFINFISVPTDQLVLQFINLINLKWMKEGLDMKLIEYSAVCTSHKKGVLEFIRDAENLAGLIKNYKAYA